jgi:hypothetical protein
MTKYALYHHIRHFSKTGIIDDALLPCFGQDGRWLGESVSNADPALHHALKKLNKTVLPVSRRTTRSRFGTVLRTSLRWSGDNPLTLTYCAIEGSLTVIGNASVHAANLRHIGGSFFGHTGHRICLPQLTTVAGSFEVGKGFLLTASRLRDVGGDLVVVGQIPPRIRSVGGRLAAFWVFDFRADHLLRIGGALVAPKAEVVVVPALESIGGGLLLGYRARRLHAPLLRSVGGDLLAASVTDMRAPRLRDIGGDMDTRSALGYYHPHVRVGGDWTICPTAAANWTRREAARRAIRGTEPPFLF